MPEQQPIPEALIAAQAARRKRRSRQWRITDHDTTDTTIDALNQPLHDRIRRAVGRDSYITNW